MTLKAMEMDKKDNKFVHSLHDSIGSLVDVYMSTNSNKEDNPLNIRGRLTSVTIDYNAGASTAFSYSIELDCVRPIPKKEEDSINIECPFYKRLNNTENPNKKSILDNIVQAYANNATGGKVNL
jgi:hypothetical protein